MQQLPLPGICPADKLCRPARRSLALNENDTPVRQHNGRNGTLVILQRYLVGDPR
jgi:hypothetical protein